MIRFLTAGESHGKALTVIVEGMVAGLPLDEEYIARDLARRQRGYGRSSRMKIERDRAEILSGVRHGLTLGSPISQLISNRDWERWKDVMSTTPVEKRIEPVTAVRPGHADLAGAIKYGQEDIRQIMERSSARETAARVATGAIARRLLEEFGIEIHSHTVAIGEVKARKADHIDWKQVEGSSVRCADSEAEAAMVAAIDRVTADGDTLGGIFELIAEGLPMGLGSHVHWDRRLDGRIAQAVMSINAVKGVEIGAGFTLAELRGSQAHDVIQPASSGRLPWYRVTNRAGGIEGGMTNGEPIVVRAAVKPIPTLGRPLPTVDLVTGEATLAHFERSDICIVPAAGVIGEAMMAIILADALLEKFGGDHLKETQRNYQGYLDSIASRRRK